MVGSIDDGGAPLDWKSRRENCPDLFRTRQAAMLQCLGRDVQKFEQGEGVIIARAKCYIPKTGT
jgi:hypothetical protein